MPSSSLGQTFVTIVLPSTTPLKRAATCLSPLAAMRQADVPRHLSGASLASTTVMSSSSTSAAPPKRSKKPHAQPQRRAGSFNWLFRSNIPVRRASHVSLNMQKRNFFGMGEIIGVITNPAETVRSLTESKRLLDEARRDINEQKERAEIRPIHTFSRVPGYFERKAEMLALKRAVEGDPSFTVLFGASSVGKTALLREVLTSDKYHVLHFDLRIAGFSDLASLYMSLSTQMELYFEAIAKDIPGYEEFEKEAWGFKHDRINVERRNTDSPDGWFVKTSDVARLMELFQSSLLKYWNFEPPEDKTDETETSVGNQSDNSKGENSAWSREQHANENGGPAAATTASTRRPKKIPVFFIDEAHKLPVLLRSMTAMKSLLDSMLVLTKQNRLCHIIHATSDPFYQTWLRQLNVMQHCQILTIGDCSKSEMQEYFLKHLLPQVPPRFKTGLRFEVLWDAFGGKIAHWQDYVLAYIRLNGKLDVNRSSHFAQAHALLNLHVLHSTPPPDPNQSQGTILNPTSQGGTGFHIYSPLNGRQNDPNRKDDDAIEEVDYQPPGFTANQLLEVMARMTQDPFLEKPYISYFPLCREMGITAVDAMVRGRVLDLQWTDPVSRDILDGAEMEAMRPGSMAAGMETRHGAAATNETMVEVESLEGDMSPLSTSDRDYDRPWTEKNREPRKVVGPRLTPITPIMRYAMRVVLQEYSVDGEDDRRRSAASEYASLSDVDEY